MNSVNVERRRQERLEKASTALIGMWESWGPWYDKAMAEYEAAYLAVHGFVPRQQASGKDAAPPSWLDAVDAVDACLLPAPPRALVAVRLLVQQPETIF